MIRKIKSKLKTLASKSIIRLGLFLRWPWLVTEGLRFASFEVNGRGEYRVLCLGRTIFLDDVNAMVTFGRRLHYVVIHREYFIDIFNYFVGKPKDREQLTEFNYHHSDILLVERRKYYALMKRVLPILRKLLSIDAVLSCNIGYQEQQEMSRVAREIDLPFIVLHKEGMVPPGSKFDARLYSMQKFTGSKLLLYNEKIRQALLDIHLNGLEPNQSLAVGVPRFDFYFTKNRPQNMEQVLFFSFYPSKLYFHYVDSSLKHDEARLQQVVTRINEFHKLVIGFAAANPHVRVLIKTKAAQYYLDYVRDMLKEMKPADIGNLVITNTGRAVDLIPDSQIVLGFGSTVLVEAVIANKLIISPRFSNLLHGTVWDYFAGFSQLVREVSTAEELAQSIQESRSYQIDKGSRDRFLHDIIYIPDGQASKRTETAIIETVKKYE